MVHYGIMSEIDILKQRLGVKYVGSFVLCQTFLKDALNVMKLGRQRKENKLCLYYVRLDLREMTIQLLTM